MDKPLFGEQKSEAKWALTLVAAGTALLVGLTVIFSFVRASIDSIHAFLGISYLLVAINLLVIVRAYRNGELEPKYKYLVAFFTVSVAVLGICANVYFWADPVPRETCPNNVGHFGNTCFYHCQLAVNQTTIYECYA